MQQLRRTTILLITSSADVGLDGVRTAEALSRGLRNNNDLLLARLVLHRLLDEGVGESDVADNSVALAALAAIDLGLCEDANLVGNAVNTLGPDELVKSHVNADIVDTKSLLDALLNLLNSPGCTLLVGTIGGWNCERKESVCEEMS